MIDQLVAYLLVYLVLAGMGLYWAHGRGDRQTRTQTWLKYSVYSLIVYAILISIIWRVFTPVALLIVLIGFVEMGLASTRIRQPVINLIALVGYSAIALGFIVFAVWFNRAFLLFIYFQVFSFDAFSQVLGQLWGRHLFMPKISPWKTLEGLVGGVTFCVVSALLAHQWVHLSWSQAAMLGLLTAVLAFLGDTLASYYKRLARIKDYGTWLPGQGGCLDRFDSLLMVGCGYACLAPLQLW